MPKVPLIIYRKGGCPWCVEAEAWLHQNGYQFELIDVNRDRAAFAEMIRISGQRYVPTLVAGDKILADFGVKELIPFLRENDLNP